MENEILCEYLIFFISKELDMASPILKVDVDLSQQDTVYFLPLAPKSKNSEKRLKIGVRLKITHNDPNHSELRIKAISFSFPGTNIDKIDMKEVPEKNMDPEDGRLTFGQTANWFNGSYRLESGSWRYNQIYLDAPAPQEMRIQIQCDGFSHPYSETFRLKAWTGEPLIMPFAIEDLADNEYIVTSAVHNYNGPPNGTQIYAHDISIQAPVNGAWTRTKNGTATKNEDIRSFGKPIRGQGTGVVTNVESGFWDNDYDAGNRTDHYGSNRVTVDYGNLIVIYSHLRRDSILVEEGDHVWAGRKLAEAGNSGNTQGSPHLHMECRLSSGRLCGMTFKNTWMLERGETPANWNWNNRVRLEGQGICEQKAALRPFATQIPPPSRSEFSVEEKAEIVAEVFGGASKGGDGFYIINGKLTRIPPRGIKSQLLKAIMEITEAEENPIAEAKRSFKTIARTIEEAAKKFAAEH
jgi:murein DD-endopeptidase MepM/ murein hydrolase activator NlpD